MLVYLKTLITVLAYLEALILVKVLAYLMAAIIVAAAGIDVKCDHLNFPQI